MAFALSFLLFTALFFNLRMLLRSVIEYIFAFLYFKVFHTIKFDGYNLQTRMELGITIHLAENAKLIFKLYFWLTISPVSSNVLHKPVSTVLYN